MKQINTSKKINTLSKQSKAVKGSFKPRLPLKSLAILFRQIGVSLNSGLSLISVLQLIESNCKNHKERKLVADFSNAIVHGGSLSEELVSWKGKIPESVIALVRVGEETGNIGDAFKSASEICEFYYYINQKIINAMLYPLFLLFFAFIILPIPGAIQNGSFVLSSYIKSISYPVGGLALAIVLFAFLLSKQSRSSDSIGKGLQQLLFRLPVIGNLKRKFSLAQFSKILSIAIDSGLGILDALQLAAEAARNPFISKKVYDIIRRSDVLNGSLASELSKTGEFSISYCGMISAGEQSGKLEEMLRKAAALYQEEAIFSLDRAMKLLNPIVFLLIAIFIGYQIFSFWSSYFGQLDSIWSP